MEKDDDVISLDDDGVISLDDDDDDDDDEMQVDEDDDEGDDIVGKADKSSQGTASLKTTSVSVPIEFHPAQPKESPVQYQPVRLIADEEYLFSDLTCHYTGADLSLRGFDSKIPLIATADFEQTSIQSRIQKVDIGSMDGDLPGNVQHFALPQLRPMLNGGGEPYKILNAFTFTNRSMQYLMIPMSDKQEMSSSNSMPVMSAPQWYFQVSEGKREPGNYQPKVNTVGFSIQLNSRLYGSHTQLQLIPAASDASNTMRLDTELPLFWWYDTNTGLIRFAAVCARLNYGDARSPAIFLTCRTIYIGRDPRVNKDSQMFRQLDNRIVNTLWIGRDVNAKTVGIPAYRILDARHLPGAQVSNLKALNTRDDMIMGKAKILDFMEIADKNTSCILSTCRDPNNAARILFNFHTERHAGSIRADTNFLDPGAYGHSGYIHIKTNKNRVLLFDLRAIMYDAMRVPSFQAVDWKKHVHVLDGAAFNTSFYVRWNHHPNLDISVSSGGLYDYPGNGGNTNKRLLATEVILATRGFKSADVITTKTRLVLFIPVVEDPTSSGKQFSDPFFGVPQSTGNLFLHGHFHYNEASDDFFMFAEQGTFAQNGRYYKPLYKKNVFVIPKVMRRIQRDASFDNAYIRLDHLNTDGPFAIIRDQFSGTLPIMTRFGEMSVLYANTVVNTIPSFATKEPIGGKRIITFNPI